MPENRYLRKWLEIGKKNPWIREAEDPPFNTQSFHECKDDAELLDRFAHGNWLGVTQLVQMSR